METDLGRVREPRKCNRDTGGQKSERTLALGLSSEIDKESSTKEDEYGGIRMRQKYITALFSSATRRIGPLSVAINGSDLTCSRSEQRASYPTRRRQTAKALKTRPPADSTEISVIGKHASLSSLAIG